MNGLHAALLTVCACAGVSADGPLTVPLGLPRETTTRALHEHQYCPIDGAAESRLATFPRCDRVGTEWSASWVTARFEEDHIVELRRWERYGDDAHALARWNQLVTAWAQRTPASAEAAAALRVHGQLLPGTRAVQAFRLDASAVVGLYLLTPTPPENAAVLEAILAVPRTP